MSRESGASDKGSARVQGSGRTAARPTPDVDAGAEHGQGGPSERVPGPQSPPNRTEVEEALGAWRGEDETEESHLTGCAASDMAPSPGAEPGWGSLGQEDPALSAVEAERDEYLDALRRLQAEFENYRKRVAKGQVEQVERASGDLVGKLLSVLDTVEMALAHATLAAASGTDDAPPPVDGGLAQVAAALTDVLTREGLERIHPLGQPFDPTEHDAVVLDAGEGDDQPGPEVTGVLRTGYRWKGRVLRPAMVKVRG